MHLTKKPDCYTVPTFQNSENAIQQEKNGVSPLSSNILFNYFDASQKNKIVYEKKQGTRDTTGVDEKSLSPLFENTIDTVSQKLIKTSLNDMPLAERIAKVRDYITKVHNAGFKVTEEALYDHFDPAFLGKLMESGQLIHVPTKDGFRIYDWSR